MPKRYVELPERKRYSQSNDIPQAASRATELSVQQAPVEVVYTLERIAAELRADLSGDTHRLVGPEGEFSGPLALVMTQGKYAKQVYGAVAAAGIGTVAPLMGDWRLDVNPKLAHASVKLGDAPSRALLTNAFAVLKAAQDAHVQCILLGFNSFELGHDNRFLMRATDAGLRVFMPFPEDQSHAGWIECRPRMDSTDPKPTAWRICHKCKLTFDEGQFAEAGWRCPQCGTLTRLSSDERLAQIADPGTFEEWDAHMEDCNPLGFPGYAEKIARYRRQSGKQEAICTGRVAIGGMPVAVGFMESTFFMGSMGSVVGEKVARLFDRATEEGLPVVLFCASGGARMQEGLASLMQMAKTACAVERHDRAGLLYISVLTDPTTGGVTASFATLGDIILAEPGALIGFAGQRVIRDTIKQELPEGFQTAEFALEHGLVDAIVERPRLASVLRTLLAFHRPVESVDGFGEAPSPEFMGAFAMVETGADARATREQASFVDRFMGRGNEKRNRRQLERHAKRELKRAGVTTVAEPGSAWESVQMARNVHRPTASAYIKALAPVFIELHGDRAFADDGAIVAGIGLVDGRPVTIVAQEKGVDLPDRIKRNFGCPQPEGYRKTARLMRQAEKFGRPIVCLVDTQGAFCGTEAEERGQGNAIAENLQLMAGLHVPVVSVLLGEGGSGGALALALSNRVAMQQHAVYSVLSPEGFASILWKDGKRAPEAAEVMGMNASEVLKMGVVDDIIAEGEEAAHVNPEQAVENVRSYVVGALAELSALSPDELLSQRQQRFARF